MNPVPSMDPWKVLGLRRGASPEIIRTAWRNGVMLFHPDTAAGSGDAEKFRLVNEAYRILRADPDHPEVTEAEDFLPSDRMPERVWKGWRHPNTNESWDDLWDIADAPAEPESWWDEEPAAAEPAGASPRDHDPRDHVVEDEPVFSFDDGPITPDDVGYESDDDIELDVDLDAEDGWDFEGFTLDPEVIDGEGAFESTDLVDLGAWQKKTPANPLKAFIRSRSATSGARTRSTDPIGSVTTLAVPADGASLVSDAPSVISGVTSLVTSHIKKVAAKLPTKTPVDGPRMSALDDARSHSVSGDVDRPGGPVMHPAFVPAGIAVIVGIRLAVQMLVPPAVDLSVLVVILLAAVATIAVRIFVGRKLIGDTLAAAGFPVLAVFLAAGDALALILVPLVAVGSILVVRARRQVASQ